MTNKEKEKLIQALLNEKDVGRFYQALENMGDLKTNYVAYMTTAPVNCDMELMRLDSADYDLCTALLTMLLREDHFINGAFEKRVKAGDVKGILERMLNVLPV